MAGGFVRPPYDDERVPEASGWDSDTRWQWRPAAGQTPLCQRITRTGETCGCTLAGDGKCWASSQHADVTPT